MKRLKKEDRVEGEVRMMKDDLFQGLREEGYQVIKPDWPPYLLVDRFGVVTFAHLKRTGERLSGKQARTMNVLQNIGFNTLIVYQKKVKRLPLEERFQIKTKIVYKKETTPLLTPQEREQKVLKEEADYLEILEKRGEKVKEET